MAKVSPIFFLFAANVTVFQTVDGFLCEIGSITQS